MALLEELKTKYQTVIQTIQAQGVELSNLHIQDGKLFMKGTAPTQEAANKIWDELKRINPKLDDVIANFPVDSSKASVRAPAQQQGARPQNYVVKPGDTLSKISKQFYGSESDYMRIFNANKDQLKDPNQIKAGQQLRIPAA